MSTSTRETSPAFGSEHTINYWLVCIAGMGVTIACASIMHAIGNLAIMPEEFKEIPQNPSADFLVRYHAAFRYMYTINYAFTFAIMGGLLGLAIALVATKENRQRVLASSSIGGSLAGALGGLLLGLVTAYSLKESISSPIVLLGISIEPLVQTTILQCAIWSTVGIGIGCGWTVAVLGRSEISTGIQGGLAGGLLGGVAYSLVGAVLFPNTNAFLFVPERLTERLIWAGIGGVCIGIGLCYSVATSRKRQKQALETTAVS